MFKKPYIGTRGPGLTGKREDWCGSVGAIAAGRQSYEAVKYGLCGLVFVGCVAHSPVNDYFNRISFPSV